MIKKIYFEITNVCNLSCSFCPKTKRENKFVSEEEFYDVLKKIDGKAEFLYLHLMGEPTLHPHLERLLDISQNFHFKIIITTNGTLLKEKGNILLSSPTVYKTSISLHSFEANKSNLDLDDYLNNCFEYAKESSNAGKFCIFRLWNLDGKNTVGENTKNSYILTQMKQYFKGNWVDTRSGKRLGDKIFLEYGEKFEWPDSNGKKAVNDDECFCHGLRDQVGILSNGTVVPCCLDSEGTINLGNIFENTFDEIIFSDKAKEFYNSFSMRKSPNPLCSNCEYAERFNKYKIKKQS